jgi:hypothetical protein
MLMEGGIRFPLAEAIWRSKTAPKIKIFKSQHRIWTSDRRLRHGLQTSMASCFKKKKEEDTTEHILLQYVQARQAWYICSQLAPIAPVQDSKLNDWWLLARRRFSYQDRRVFDTFVSCVGIDLVDTRQMDWHNTTMPPASVSGVAAQQEQIYILSYFFVFSFFLKNIKKT